ncbi:MAG: hypothetical protein GY754_17070 [bacterium]|nr:hypothetical protein [bacterium]
MNKSVKKIDQFNNFYYDGTEFGDGVHYTCLDYVPVSKFTPLTGTNWWRLNSIKTKPVITKNRADIRVECIRCGDSGQKQEKVLRIEVISYDRNLFRIRFNPYAENFNDYDSKENTFGPITRKQLDWIQEQNTKAPDISYDAKCLTVTLKDVEMTVDTDCVMTVTSRHTGKIIHQDGWVTPPEMNADNQPRGIVFVDEQYGSAAAVIKRLPRDKKGLAPNYYGCGECQNYYETGDAQQNHSSSLDRSGQVVTFFNYDNYEMDQTELKPPGEPGYEAGSEQSFIPQYTTVPFFIEYPNDNSYAYGLLLDNTSQSYINMGSREFTGAFDPDNTKNIQNVYYVGAQYPELDYYLIFPSIADPVVNTGLIASILDNYTLLTGKEHDPGTKLNLRGAMPPKYIFGFFQGVYGFTGISKGDWPVQSVVEGYRNNAIPLEGLAIDVDVQEQFEVFTTNGQFWEGLKVGSGDSVFEWAHKQDLVCQTNITNFIRNDQQNYKVYDSMKKNELYTKCSRFIDFGDGSDLDSPYQAILPYTGTTAVFPHFGNPNTPAWWGRNYWDEKQVPHPLLRIGLDFVWQDMTVPAMSPHILGNKVYNKTYNNTPGCYDLTGGIFNWKTYHGQQLYGDPRNPETFLPYIALRNLHAYMECKATYELGLTIKGQYPSKFNRSYIISRGGYFGLAHFGGLWTGDNASGWKYMQIELPKALNMGLCGFPIVGADVGGFAPSLADDFNHCQEHLMVRWVQAASLLPWFRDHYVNERHGGKAFQELYNFDWDYNGRKYSDIMNDFVKMRVRFHHVLYSSMYTFCQTGLPPVKPTCLYEGGSGSSSVMTGFTLCQDSQYFIGDCAIMAAPALEDENCEALKNHEAKNYPSTIYQHPIWFPADSKWFPYDARYDGPCDPGKSFGYTRGLFGFYQGEGNVSRFTVPLENMPVFIREGAILPTRVTMDGSVKNIQQLDNDDEPFVFDIWPGAENSTYQCYFDDGGKTKNAELDGKYSLVSLKQTSDTEAWKIEFTYDYHQSILPGYFYIRLRAAVSGDVSDSRENSYSACSDLSGLFMKKGYAFFYDKNRQEQWIKVPTDKLDGLIISKNGSFTISLLPFPRT